MKYFVKIFIFIVFCLADVTSIQAQSYQPTLQYQESTNGNNPQDITSQGSSQSNHWKSNSQRSGRKLHTRGRNKTQSAIIQDTSSTNPTSNNTNAVTLPTSTSLDNSSVSSTPSNNSNNSNSPSSLNQMACNPTLWGSDAQSAKEKVAQYLMDIKQAASMNNINWQDLAAVMMQETRGLTAEMAGMSSGLMQCGEPEIKSLKEGIDPLQPALRVKSHPELLTADDPNYLSSHNQIYGAAAYIGELFEKYNGDMIMALNVYNKGDNFSAGMGDPNYINNHNEALSVLACFNF
jgi:Transglycosylase SLT domain